MKLLDLFCGAGGSAVGYRRAGFDVFGVDNRPQRSYPFAFRLADALTVSLDEWDVIHASPPCQRWSIANRVHSSKGANWPDLIGPIRERLIESGKPYIIENVRLAPLVDPVLLCGTMFGLKVFRHRLFESNVPLLAPMHPQHDGGTGSHRGYSTSRSGRNGFVCVAGHNFELEAGKRAMGIDWVSARWELVESVPPSYTEYVGSQIWEALT